MLTAVEGQELLRQARHDVRRLARSRRMKLRPEDEDDLVGDVCCEVVAHYDPTRGAKPATLSRYWVMSVFRKWSASLEGVPYDPQRLDS